MTVVLPDGKQWREGKTTPTASLIYNLHIQLKTLTRSSASRREKKRSLKHGVGQLFVSVLFFLNEMEVVQVRSGTLVQMGRGIEGGGGGGGEASS